MQQEALHQVAWRIFPDSHSLACALVKRVRRVADGLPRKCKVVFSGGRSLIPFFEQLVLQVGVNWNTWDIYLTDERCLPPEHSMRNSRTLEECLLRFINIHPSKVHMISSELGPREAAFMYESVIQEAGAFDIVVMGVGEDGHVASLFGNDPSDLRDLASVVPVTNAPKWPSERVSLSLDSLSNTSNMFIVATGESKRSMVKQWRLGAHLPVSMLNPKFGIEAYVDTAAYY